MSCITKLLEMKGDKEFLACHSQAGIEGGGVYKGYEYLISFTSLGHRCGYVAIPNGVAGDFDDINCHGGITFEGIDHGFKDLLDQPCADLWIGFDAAHCDDLANLDTALKYFSHIKKSKRSLDVLNTITKDSFETLSGLGCIHRSYEYMEDECKSIIEQLITQQQGEVHAVS